MTLAEFLLACLAERQRLAEAAIGRRWHAQQHSALYTVAHDDERAVEPCWYQLAVSGTEGGPHAHHADHDDRPTFAYIAANDPAFALADIEAKRAIVAAYVDSLSRRDIYQSAEARAVEDDRQRQRRRAEAARCRGLEIAVQALAFTFADRPGYREEWRP